MGHARGIDLTPGEESMKKLITVSLVAMSALGLAACGTQGGDNVIVNEVVTNDDFPADANIIEPVSNGDAVNETGASLNAGASANEAANVTVN
jgi:hypothetical protein